MAKLCTNCGTELPRDDARFCAVCGTLIGTHPKNIQLAEVSLDAAKVSPTPTSLQNVSREASKTHLREQVAQQPPARISKHEDESPPAWMNRLDEKPISKNIPERPKPIQRGTPQNVSAVWEPPVREPREPQNTPHAEYTNVAEKPVVIPQAQGRELRVKVWTEEEMEEPFEGEESVEDIQDQGGIEQMPTEPLLLEDTASKQSATALQDVEYIDTTPLSPVVNHDKDVSDTLPSQPSIPDIKTVQMPMAVVPRISSSSPDQPLIPKDEQQPMPIPIVPSLIPQPKVTVNSRPAIPRSVYVRRRTTNTRMLLLMVVVLAIVIVLFGGMWLWLYQPFSVAPVTQPQQRMNDSSVGVSLLYPTGWTGKSDQKTASIHLYDSSNTAKMMISKINQNVTDITSYLKNQATQQGMTGLKEGSALTFASASWRQVEGNIAQKGANYTEVMLVTTHNGQLFIIVQLAPQNVYRDEETTVFSGVRSSLRFS